MKKIIYTSIILFIWISGYAQNVESVIKSDPFSISGSLSANAGLSSISNGEDRTSPFHYGLVARMNIKIYGFSNPLYLSFRDHSFNYGGSLYRLRLNPQYKWVKLHIGDVFMQFNPYVLSGRNVRGFGVELTPGKFRFKGLIGKIKDLNAFQDTLAFGTTEVETFTRKSKGFSLGYGSGANRFDIHLMHTEDPDSTEFSLIENANRFQNIVLGTNFQVRPFNNFSLQFNSGLSYLTNLETVDDNEKASLVTYNSSTTYSYAGDLGFAYQLAKVGFNAKVKYIQPFYNPLTAQYINNDLINYTVGFNYTVGRRVFYINSSFGIQKNNLSGFKVSTANRFIANMLANIRFSRSLSSSFTFTNFQQEYSTELVSLGETFNFIVTTRNLIGTLKYRTSGEIKNYSLGFSAGRQTFTNVSDLTDDNNYQSFNSKLTAGVNFKESGLRLGAGINFRNYSNSRSDNQNYGLNLNVQKKLDDIKMTIAYRSGYILTNTDGKRNGTTFRNMARLSYKISKSQAVQLQLGHIIRSTPFSESFSEFRSNISINTNF